MSSIKAAVVGGTGYTGGEALRLLLQHPEVSVIETTSRSHAGKRVDEIHPNLSSHTDLTFQDEDLGRLNEEADVLFFGLPHGVSMDKIAQLDLDATNAIDLGADFRLDSASTYEHVYEENHVAPELLDEAVYGLTEFNRDAISDASLVACPGCFPTGALLAILPLVRSGQVEDRIIVDSKTGSSGSGRSASSATHHPERAMDFRAYSVFQHRHEWEIKQESERQAQEEFDITFTPHSAPMIRGIYTTAYLTLTSDLDRSTVEQHYKNAYSDAPLVRIVDRPRSTVVESTCMGDVAVKVDGDNVIALSAIDNLLKGAGGQGVQNMNLMFDLPEDTGLTYAGTHP
jgi:N-acetyl-gamma-glutamyl-phosphate reductase